MFKFHFFLSPLVELKKRRREIWGASIRRKCSARRPRSSHLSWRMTMRVRNKERARNQRVKVLKMGRNAFQSKFILSLEWLVFQGDCRRKSYEQVGPLRSSIQPFHTRKIVSWLARMPTHINQCISPSVLTSTIESDSSRSQGERQSFTRLVCLVHHFFFYRCRSLYSSWLLLAWGSVL